MGSEPNPAKSVPTDPAPNNRIEDHAIARKGSIESGWTDLKSSSPSSYSFIINMF